MHTVGFSSSDSVGDFTKSMKKFVTSDMEDCKETSCVNSINFDGSTKIYANMYFTPQYDSHRKNYLWPIYEIKNVVSDD